MREMVSRRVEDYLRTVYEIIEEKGYARIKDIAREFATLLVKLLTKKEDYRHIHESAQNYSSAKKYHLRGEQAT